MENKNVFRGIRIPFCRFKKAMPQIYLKEVNLFLFEIFLKICD